MNKNKYNDVFVLTAIHNDIDKTKLFLKSLYSQTYPNIKVYIIDDGSTDNTAKSIHDNYPDIVLIGGNGKLWWTGALHLGITEILKVAKTDDYVLTINNDCTFSKDYIKNLLYSCKKHKRSIIGSLVINKTTNKIWDAGVCIDWKNWKFIDQSKKVEIERRKNNRYIKNLDMLSTKGTIFPLNTFKSVGNFDKRNFPHYLSDYDFTYKANKKNYNLLVDLKAKLFNVVERTGREGINSKKISWKELWFLFFNRKSKVNVVDQYNFINIHCPNKYKLLNYLLLIAKIIHYILHVFPFYYFPIILYKTKKLFGIENVSISKLFWRKFK